MKTVILILIASIAVYIAVSVISESYDSPSPKIVQKPVVAAAEKEIAQPELAANEADVMPLAYDEPSPERQKWSGENSKAWAQIRVEFPDWMTAAEKENTIAVVRDWDKWAEVNAPKLYNDPWKPLYYLREQNKRLLTQERQAASQGIPEWESHVDNAYFQESLWRKRNPEAAAQEDLLMDLQDKVDRIEREKRFQRPKNDGYHMRR